MKIAHVLMVEDNEGDVLLAQMALRKAKVRVDLSIVVDGEEAMEFLRREGRHASAQPADLVLLDLNLPRMSGREVLAAMKADPDLKKIPVVVLTSSRADADIQTSYNLHANCYVVKPVGAKEFEEIIHAVDSFWFSIVTLPGPV